jgi:hypothetical protein
MVGTRDGSEYRTQTGKLWYVVEPADHSHVHNRTMKGFGLSLHSLVSRSKSTLPHHSAPYREDPNLPIIPKVLIEQRLCVIPTL